MSLSMAMMVFRFIIQRDHVSLLNHIILTKASLAIVKTKLINFLISIKFIQFLVILFLCL
jgi:hypothetical protein